MRFQIETSVFKSLRRGVDREQKDNFSLSWRLPFPFLFFTLLIAYVISHLDNVPFTKMKRKTSISPMLSDDVHRTKNKVLGSNDWYRYPRMNHRPVDKYRENKRMVIYQAHSVLNPSNDQDMLLFSWSDFNRSSSKSKTLCTYLPDDVKKSVVENWNKRTW